jgi:glycosyltransferase involved in cell wall biosynthesis
MKILLVAENFYPESNAPSKRLFEHAKEWIRLGNEVTVLTGVPNAPKGKVFEGYKNKIYQSEKVEGIKIIRVWTFIAKNERFLLRTLDFISFMFSSFFFGLFIKKHDKIIVSSPQFLPVISGFIIAKIKNIPFILEIRDLWPESIVALGAIKKNNYIIKSLYAITKYIYQKSELIVVVTKAFKENLIDMGVKKDKIIIIENGFSFDSTLKPNRSIETIEKEYNITNNNFTVSYIGTIGMSHGIKIIVEAAQLIKDVNFFIIGEGAEKESLQKITRDKKINNIMFIDNINWQEIVNINQIISVNLIHLRNLELFKTVIPSKIFESMALKKPILAGLIGESLDIITQSKSGLKVIPENPNSLVEKILQMKNNQNLCDELASNGFKLVQERYNRKILAGKMIDRISSL